MNANASICQDAAAYSTFVDVLPTFWAEAGETLGNLITRMARTDGAAAPVQVGTGLAKSLASAVAAKPFRIDVRTEHLTYFADAIASLPPD